ncbi:MAG TPA: lamin tail domain-containing protein, partial [Salinivirgaceae bacterium]|nr:lamin tail domain-containing protein [Salinivirgaceae bacterium]
MKRILLTTMALSLTAVMFAQKNCSQIFFSEYVEGSGNNKALEIYNPTSQSVNLNRYHMARYRNGATVGDYVSFPSNLTIGPKNVLVAVLDKRDPNGTGQDTMVSVELQALADIFLCPVYNTNPMMYFNGNDAVTIEDKITGAILDIIGKIGEDPGLGWNNNPETNYSQTQWYDPNHWTYNNTMVRKPNVTIGVSTNPDFFNPELEWDTIGQDNFSNLRTHNCTCGFNNIETPARQHK